MILNQINIVTIISRISFIIEVILLTDKYIVTQNDTAYGANMVLPVVGQDTSLSRRPLIPENLKSVPEHQIMSSFPKQDNTPRQVDYDEILDLNLNNPTYPKS